MKGLGSRAAWAALAGALAATGCPKSDPNRGIEVLAVHPVRGAVTVAAKPAPGAMLSFHPAGEAKAYRPRAVAADDGAFEATTYRRGDGAPEGEYVVTIYWPADRPKSRPADADSDPTALPADRLRGRYSDPKTSTLRATVKPGENRVDFPLP